MLGLFKKDPLKEMNKEYEGLLKQGMEAQRNGDMRLYAELATKADELYKKIQTYQQNNMS